MKLSVEISKESLVIPDIIKLDWIPMRFISNVYFPKRARRTKGSKKYGIARSFPQLNSTEVSAFCRTPGMYLSDVPYLFI